MKIQNVLKNYGLNEKQIQVYMSCLELGSAPVQKISQKSGLVRTSVYEILEVLRKKGFVNLFLKKKVKYYSAEDPEQVFRLAQNKLDSLKEILPELNALYGNTRNRPRVRFYQGKEAMKLIMEEILSEAKELECFGAIDDLLKETGDYHEKFVERRIKNKIPLRVILKDTKTARTRKLLGAQQLRKVKLMVDSSIDSQGLIFIWNYKIAMFSYVQDLIGVVVESKVLANTQKSFFDNLWNCLPE